jgi:hypothetical protein
MEVRRVGRRRWWILFWAMAIGLPILILLLDALVLVLVYVLFR